MKGVGSSFSIFRVDIESLLTVDYETRPRRPQYAIIHRAQGETFMEINYQETSKDLLTRIAIHEKYGSANIDEWTNDLLKPARG